LVDELIRDIVFVLATATVVMIVFARLRIPPVVGLFVAGVLVGPEGLGFVHEPESVHVLAELGIVLLLFTIGMEFSLPDLIRARTSLLVGGTLQMGLTAVIVMLIAWQTGREWETALVWGLLAAVSSSAIVLGLLQSRGELDTPHGRNSLSILVFQDLIVVPLILLMPLLAGETGDLGNRSVWSLLLLAAGGPVVLALAFWATPRLLFLVARTGSREIFLVTVLALCFGVAALSAWAGMSLALGAFMAGLLIASSDAGRQALGSVIPLRDALMGFFFVSVGMLMDPSLLLERIWILIPLALGIILLKAFTATTAVTLLGYPIGTALTSGVSLAQVGEFSFVLAEAALAVGLLSDGDYQTFLTLTVLTMTATPFLIANTGGLIERMSHLRPLARLGGRRQPDRTVRLHDHLVIVGFGLNGRNLARAAQTSDIPYVIIELNPVTVKTEAARGHHMVFGDADNEAVLEHARVEQARVAVVVINDPAATRRIVARLRSLNAGLHIIARTRYLAEVDALHDLGADEVVPEEFETSLEIFKRTLRGYLVPEDEILAHEAEIRALDYGLLRDPPEPGSAPRPNSAKPAERDVDVRAVRIVAGSSTAGKTLEQAALRREHSVTVLAVRRKGRTIANPSADERLQEGDVVIMLGRGPDLTGAACALGHPSESRPDEDGPDEVERSPDRA
jgi:CPA2 family monovalent cation:H+ antiporter-2